MLQSLKDSWVDFKQEVGYSTPEFKSIADIRDVSIKNVYSTTYDRYDPIHGLHASSNSEDKKDLDSTEE